MEARNRTLLESHPMARTMTWKWYPQADGTGMGVASRSGQMTRLAVGRDVSCRSTSSGLIRMLRQKLIVGSNGFSTCQKTCKKSIPNEFRTI